MSIEHYLVIATAIERAIEAFKRAVLERFLAEDRYASVRGVIAFILSLIAGVLVAFGLGLNMFASLGATYILAGTLLTGMFMGAGSNAVHRAWDLIAKLTPFLDARVNAVQSQARVIKSETVDADSENRLSVPRVGAGTPARG